MTYPVFLRQYLTCCLLMTVGLAAVTAAVDKIPAYAQAEDIKLEEDLAQTTGGLPSLSSELAPQGADSPPSTRPAGVKLGMVVFVPPAEDAIPKRSLGAGTRNNQCANSADTSNAEAQRPQVLALVPPSQGVGLTEQEKPTLWFYQSTPLSIRQILVSVREADTLQFHSQTVIDLPPEGPWVALQLAEEAPPLKPDIDYEWSVMAVCGDRPGPNDPSLSTWIRRVTPQSSHRSPEATPLSLAQQYAQQGLWYDLVTVLMQAQQSPPEREWLSETWSELLNYAGLSSLAPAPPSPSSIQSDS